MGKVRGKVKSWGNRDPHGAQSGVALGVCGATLGEVGGGWDKLGT